MPPLLERLDFWLHQWQAAQLDAIAFAEEHPILREQSLELGYKLEELATQDLEIPDDIYRALSHCMEILDSLWDASLDQELPYPIALEAMLTDAHWAFSTTLADLEGILNDIAWDSPGTTL